MKKKKKRVGNKAKIKKTKNWFFEKINSQTVSQIHQGKKKKKRRGVKSIKLEMRMRNHNRQHRNTKDHKRLL